MFDATEYYHNKAFELTDEEQEWLLDYFRGLQKEWDEAYANKQSDLREEISEDIRDARRKLEKEGILIAHNWPGHRHEWFFPTYGDAEAYEDWLIQCSDQEIYMVMLHELLACSGNTRDYEQRFELWVHPAHDDPYQVEFNMHNVLKYAGCPVIYFSPDHRNNKMWIDIGVQTW